MHVSEVTSVLSNSLQPMYSAHIKLWSRGRGRRANAQGSVSSVQSLSRVRLFATLWTAAHQASLSFTIFWSLPKFMSIESMTPSNHLILCHPLLLLLQSFSSSGSFLMSRLFTSGSQNIGDSASASVLPKNIQG